MATWPLIRFHTRMGPIPGGTPPSPYPSNDASLAVSRLAGRGRLLGGGGWLEYGGGTLTHARDSIGGPTPVSASLVTGQIARLHPTDHDLQDSWGVLIVVAGY